MITRVTHHISSEPKHHVIQAGPEYGTNFVLGRIRDTQPHAIWVHQPDRTDLDPVEQGYLLSKAVNQAAGRTILPRALPLKKALAALKLYARPNVTTHLLISNAQPDSEFLDAVLEQSPQWLKVVAATPHEISDDRAIIVPAKELLLTEDEALTWPAVPLAPEQVKEAWEATEGVLTPFLVECSARAEVPPPLMPGSEAPEFLPGQEVSVPADILFDALIVQERWMSALELALAAMPHRAIEVLDQAGHAYHQLGQHQRLYALIGQLPPEARDTLPALFWLLSSALRVNKAAEHREEIEAFLQNHDAPDLRALYAGTMLPYEEGVKEAKRAYELRRTPLTAFQYGRMLLEQNKSLSILNESIHLAEQIGHPYEVARNAEALATKLLRAGEYQNAEHWAAFALKKFNKHKLTDEYRHLLLLNAWAFARLMLGKTAGLEDVLRDHTLGRDSGLLPWARHLFRSTTADFLLATNRPDAALPIYEELMEETGRSERPMWLSGIARCLLQLGRRQEAAELVDQHIQILQEDQPSTIYYALVARALTRLETHPREAERDAEAVVREPKAVMWTRLQAAVTLAAIYLDRDDEDAAQAVLAEHQTALQEVGATGRRLLAPDHLLFQRVWALKDHLSEDIEVQLLGSPAQVFRQQELVKVTPRMQEALAIILLAPSPIGLDEFMEAMGETKRRPIQVLLSKLRALLPVSKAPLTLEAFYTCDAEQVLEACAKNDVKSALHHYKGELLPFSDSPGVIELRDHIENTLRKCVLAHGDAEDILALAQKTHDDLELWEIAQKRARPDTPHADLIAARIQRLEREYALA